MEENGQNRRNPRLASLGHVGAGDTLSRAAGYLQGLLHRAVAGLVNNKNTGWFGWYLFTNAKHLYHKKFQVLFKSRK